MVAITGRSLREVVRDSQLDEGSNAEDLVSSSVCDIATNVAPVVLTWRCVALEAEILAVLDTPHFPGEQIAVAFQRKERELGEVFARLTIADAMELHRRLTLRLADDPIATRFSRLVVERRTRLLAFLADARRRAALADRHAHRGTTR